MHVVTEALKLAAADRDVFYGDPAFVDVPLGTLLSEVNVDARCTLIGDVAGEVLRPSELHGATDALAALRALAGSETAEVLGTGEPTFLDVPEVEGEHGAPRRRRSVRQCRLGDALGRLAAVVAGDPRARLRAEHPRPDVLARRAPAVLPRPGQASAHDPDPDDRDPRRRAAPGSRYAGW